MLGNKKGSTVINGHAQGRDYSGQVARLKLTQSPNRSSDFMSKGFDHQVLRALGRQVISPIDTWNPPNRVKGSQRKKVPTNLSRAAGAP